MPASDIEPTAEAVPDWVTRQRRLLTEAETIDALAEWANDSRRLVFEQLAEGLSALEATRLITAFNDALTCRILKIHQASVGLHDVRYAWMALGSEGRQEQTLLTDQDNAIVFSIADPQAARHALLPLAHRVNESLERCGLPLCPGNVMAGKPAWCLSLEEWQGRFSGWIERGDADALLHGSIFFDFRAVYGDGSLVEKLRTWLLERVRRRPVFLHLMAKNALRNMPPLGWFGQFRLQRGREGRYFNIKINAVALVTDAARILSLARGAPAIGTPERLRAWAVGDAERADVESWIGAFATLQEFRLRRQLQNFRSQRRLDNDIYPSELIASQRSALRTSLRRVRAVQAFVAYEYGAGRPG
jgi:CBS domain-containing protein